MLYFRGCTAREKDKKIADATESLLKLLDVDYFTLLNEQCCGSVLLRTGFTDEAQEQISKNLELFGDETILTSCAGCYKTFKEDYPDLDVIHISQLLANLIKEGKFKLNNNNLNVTYHDPCHLARHCGEFEASREVIKASSNLIEMDNIKDKAVCCGAGGGVKSAYPKIAENLANSRLDEASKTGAEILITSCPFCKLNLNNKKMEVLDLTEFLIKYGDIDER